MSTAPSRPKPPVHSFKRGTLRNCATHGFRRENLGVHALVFAGGWAQTECEQAVENARRAGFELLEVPLLSPSDVDVTMTRSVLEGNGMQCTTSLGLSLYADINSEDGECVERGIGLLTAALDTTHAIGGTHMVGVLYSALHKYPSPCSPLCRQNVVRSLQLVADRAHDKGVTLGLEIVNRYETNVVNTATEGMALLSDVNRPNVVIHLDSYHMNIEEYDMGNAVRVCGNKLGYVHIGESHRGYLGTGSVDFRSLFRALEETGYDSPIVFESFSSAVVSKDLSNTLCIWRNLWSDGLDLAQHAHSFICSEVQAAKQGLDQNRFLNQ